ncbi:hypothetical protein Ancab_014228 [Ancistrocladus abbreviatus]
MLFKKGIKAPIYVKYTSFTVLIDICRIIVAVLSVIERFGDVFISWLPLYAEMKLVFIIYLWYPKTKGTHYVYETFLQPFVAKHETEIERNLQDLRLRVWDLALYYMQNCTQLGQTAFFEVLQYLSNQSARLKGVGSKKNDQSQSKGSPPPPPPAADFLPFPPLRRTNVDSSRRPKSDIGPNSPSVTKRWLPSAPPMPSTFSRSEVQSAKSKLVQVEPKEAETGYIHVEEARVEETEVGKPKLARLGVRRAKPE